MHAIVCVSLITLSGKIIYSPLIFEKNYIHNNMCCAASICKEMATYSLSKIEIFVINNQ